MSLGTLAKQFSLALESTYRKFTTNPQRQDELLTLNANLCKLPSNQLTRTPPCLLQIFRLTVINKQVV
jgi:hypothetical protein